VGCGVRPQELEIEVQLMESAVERVELLKQEAGVAQEVQQQQSRYDRRHVHGLVCALSSTAGFPPAPRSLIAELQAQVRGLQSELAQAEDEHRAAMTRQSEAREEAAAAATAAAAAAAASAAASVSSSPSPSARALRDTQVRGRGVRGLGCDRCARWGVTWGGLTRQIGQLRADLQQTRATLERVQIEKDLLHRYILDKRPKPREPGPIMCSTGAGGVEGPRGAEVLAGDDFN
jgi:multidrug efflux pump subunit AcrA (membrane-fusion protein)